MTSSNVMSRGSFDYVIRSAPRNSDYSENSGSIVVTQLADNVSRVVAAVGHGVVSQMNAMRRSVGVINKKAADDAKLSLGETIMFKPMLNYQEVFSKLKDNGIEFSVWKPFDDKKEVVVEEENENESEEVSDGKEKVKDKKEEGFKYMRGTPEELAQVLDGPLASFVQLDQQAIALHKARGHQASMQQQVAQQQHSTQPQHYATMRQTGKKPSKSIAVTPGTAVRFLFYSQDLPRVEVELPDFTKRKYCNLLMQQFIWLSTEDFMQPEPDEFHEGFRTLWFNFDTLMGTSLHAEYVRLKNAGGKGSVFDLVETKQLKGKPLIEYVYAFIQKHFNFQKLFEYRVQRGDIVLSTVEPPKAVQQDSFNISNASTGVVERVSPVSETDKEKQLKMAVIEVLKDQAKPMLVREIDIQLAGRGSPEFKRDDLPHLIVKMIGAKEVVIVDSDNRIILASDSKVKGAVNTAV